MGIIIRQGFPSQPSMQAPARRVTCFDGHQFRITVARHADHANDHVVVEVGNSTRLPDVAAQLSPADARKLAVALVAAAEALEGGDNVAFIARVPR
jgi:uncharacterized membrane protein